MGFSITTEGAHRITLPVDALYGFLQDQGNLIPRNAITVRSPYREGLPVGLVDIVGPPGTLSPTHVVTADGLVAVLRKRGYSIPPLLLFGLHVEDGQVTAISLEWNSVQEDGYERVSQPSAG